MVGASAGTLIVAPTATGADGLLGCTVSGGGIDAATAELTGAPEPSVAVAAVAVAVVAKPPAGLLDGLAALAQPTATSVSATTAKNRHPLVTLVLVTLVPVTLVPLVIVPLISAIDYFVTVIVATIPALFVPWIEQ